MLSQTIKFTSFVPPALAIFQGTKYVVPGYYKVPMETTIEEVFEHWTREEPKISDKFSKSEISEQVISKRTGESYTVHFNGKYWSCTCVGASFNRTCKHIKEVSSKYKV